VQDQIDCRLSSGECLRFTRVRDGWPLAPSGGNFLYVAEGEEGPKVLYAGQTDNLATDAGARWAEASAQHGAEAIFTRLNVTNAARRREHVELLQALDPPMNAGEPRPEPKALDTPGENGQSPPL
jgi:hypothetical protein